MSARLIQLFVIPVVLVAFSVQAQTQVAFRAASSATGTGITPAFLAASSAATTGSTLSINKPSGTLINHVLVASVAVTPSSVTITPPSGWTLVRRMDNASPTSNSLAVYYKVAVSGEPLSYAWGVSGASFAVGGIRTFTGIDIANPMNAENGQSTPSGLTHVAPAITTGTANSLLVASHAFASSRTWTPPSGMTEAFDQRSGANSATGLAIQGSHLLQTVAGNSGNKTATAAGDADAGNAHLLALRPAKAALTLARPAGAVEGDVMIAAIAFNNATATITPVGPFWTFLRRIDNSTTTSNSLAIYWAVVDPNMPSSSQWGIAGASFIVGGIQAFSGVDPFHIIDAESGQSTPAGTAHDTPSITTIKPNSMLVTTHTYASSQSWTPQAGLTESFDRPSGSASTTGQSITGARQLQTTVGPSGAKRSTAAASGDAGNTHILALRPFTNQVPVISLTSPPNGASFSAPADVTVAATASDPDGSVQRVVFYMNGAVPFSIEVTSPPYTAVWNDLPEGEYSVFAEVVDNEGAWTLSEYVDFTVNRAAALHFIHVDHLNTPRLVANQSGQTVWRRDQQEPFGVNVPDENPSGLGAFEFPLRFPGQYADKETGLHYSYFRDCYDSATGRYCQTDPIGAGLYRDMAFRSLGSIAPMHPKLAAMLYSAQPRYNHVYGYAMQNPLSYTDPLGLDPLSKENRERSERADRERPGDPSGSSSSSTSGSVGMSPAQMAQCKACREDAMRSCLIAGGVCAAGICGVATVTIVGGVACAVAASSAVGGSCWYMTDLYCSSVCTVK